MSMNSTSIDEAMARCLQPATALVVALCVLTTCIPNTVTQRSALVVDRVEPHDLHAGPYTQTERVDHVVVVAIDGVRWQDVFGGADPKYLHPASRANVPLAEPFALMPEVHRVAQTEGMLLGRDDSKVWVSSPSTVSLPGYSELFGGRSPRCSDNDCAGATEETLLDVWHREEPSAALVVVSSWPRIARVMALGKAPIVTSAGRHITGNLDAVSTDSELSESLRAGRASNPAPGIDGYRPDRYTAPVALRILELMRPKFLFLGLGDTDEHAHAGNYLAYLTALRAADAVVGEIERWLKARREEGKRTLLVVTTDHGRSATFQNHTRSRDAARIWMLWSGNAVLARGYPPAPDTRLSDMAPTISALQGWELGPSAKAGHDILATLGRAPLLPAVGPPDSVALGR